MLLVSSGRLNAYQVSLVSRLEKEGGGLSFLRFTSQRSPP
jgi:hypothetical protein